MCDDLDNTHYQLCYNKNNLYHFIFAARCGDQCNINEAKEKRNEPQIPGYFYQSHYQK